MTKLITFLILLGFSLISVIDNKQEPEGIVITKESLKNDKGYGVNPRKDWLFFWFKHFLAREKAGLQYKIKFIELRLVIFLLIFVKFLIRPGLRPVALKNWFKHFLAREKAGFKKVTYFIKSYSIH